VEPSTSPEDVAAPVELIELSDLKTLAGNPVKVYVEKLPEEVLVDIMRTLPGEVPLQNGSDDPTLKEDRARRWLAWAPQLIEASTYMVRNDGTEVRPAFKWGDPIGTAVRGTYLSAGDRTKLMYACLKLSGWLKEAAASATFHAGVGIGGDGGAGVVDAGEGERPDAVGSPA
jgi:hypothetical protein